MSWEEMEEWIQFNRLFPFDPIMSAFHNSHIVQTLANINRDPKQRNDPYTIDDFMLFKLPEAKKAVAPEAANDGAHIAPETLMFLFSKAMQKNG